MNLVLMCNQKITFPSLISVDNKHIFYIIFELVSLNSNSPKLNEFNTLLDH